MRFMLVEDDALLGEALAVGLRQLDHIVEWFRDGAQADQALADGDFDAVILDLGLPGADGTTWLSRWRGKGYGIPILILTARDEVDQRIRGLDSGADEYLVKPTGVDELAAHLRALVRRAAGRPQPVWRHGELAYDPGRKAVFWKGIQVDLTTRELTVLESLLNQPNRVLSRAQLQQRLYDWQSDEPESNTLDVYIHRLRRKIDPNIIRTIRGVGYALGSGQPTQATCS